MTIDLKDVPLKVELSEALQSIANLMIYAYEAGHDHGYDEGYDEGYDKGCDADFC